MKKKLPITISLSSRALLTCSLTIASYLVSLSPLCPLPTCPCHSSAQNLSNIPPQRKGQSLYNVSWGATHLSQLHPTLTSLSPWLVLSGLLAAPTNMWTLFHHSLRALAGTFFPPHPPSLLSLQLPSGQIVHTCWIQATPTQFFPPCALSFSP